MGERTRFWTIVETLLLHEAETRHSIWQGLSLPEHVAAANEELWRAAKEASEVPDGDSDAVETNCLLLSLIEKHRLSVVDDPRQITECLWRLVPETATAPI